MVLAETQQIRDQTTILTRGFDGPELSSQLRIVEDKAVSPRKGVGTIIPIGGSATMENLQTVVEFVRGDTAITVVTIPTGEPDETFEELHQQFRELNHTGNINHLRATTDRYDGQQMLGESSLLYFTGGGQVEAMKTMTKKGWLVGKIQQFHKEGNTVAGTSAGNSVLAAEMAAGETEKISDGKRVREPEIIMYGLGLTEFALDQHVRERGRQWRVASMADLTQRTTFGFNEGSGGIIFGDAPNEVHVFGSTGGYVAWQTNRGVELQEVAPGYKVIVPIFNRQFDVLTRLSA